MKVAVIGIVNFIRKIDFMLECWKITIAAIKLSAWNVFALSFSIDTDA